jgi:hypothetical protein
MAQTQRPLTPAQHALVAIALKRSAELELALGNDDLAGARLLAFLEEAREAAGGVLRPGRVQAAA